MFPKQLKTWSGHALGCRDFDFSGFCQPRTGISSYLMANCAKNQIGFPSNMGLCHANTYHRVSWQNWWLMLTETRGERNLRNELSCQLSCQLWSVSCCLWWNRPLEDFILRGWPTGMCFCLGSAALALIWGGRPFVLYQASNSLASVGLCCLLDHLLH